MSVNTYLADLASMAVIKEQEKASIQKSIDVLQDRLRQYLCKDISEHFIFGSYSRGTILPRNMD